MDLDHDTSDIRIRIAFAEDAPEIASVLLESFIEYKALYTPKGFAATTPSSAEIQGRLTEGPTWVVTCSDHIVGTVSVVPRDDSLYVRGMAIVPAARGKGVGKLLLRQVELYASEFSYQRLFLSTTPFLERAISLYEHYGFKRTSAGPDDLFGTPIFTMEKLLEVQHVPLSVDTFNKMPSTNNRIVQVDVTIELKDYFSAYVGSAKTKLIVACLIVAVVIAAFTYFFILIGEETILWQLSPLIFGLPIVAIVGQFLRVHASYRKYLKDLSDSEKNIRYIFKNNGDGFDIVRGKNFSHVAWESVRSIKERSSYFQFVLNKYQSIIIPKRFFLNSSDEKLMKDILRSQVGHKAELLKST